MSSTDPAAPPAAAGGSKRWLPLAVLALLAGLAFAMGWHEYLSFRTIGLNYDWLKSYIAANFALALLAYMGLYVAVVALSLPGALPMTLAGGLLFGWQTGAPATVVAATVGATLIFLAARTSLGDSLAAKAGPAVARLAEGFKENALSYLLFLRLVPAFPFFVVNLAPALFGVPLSTFALGTFLGIIPGTTAFSIAGAGLGSVVEAQNAVYKACLAAHPEDAASRCQYTIDTTQLVTTELLAAFAVLGLVALIPVAFKKWGKRHAV